MKRIFTPREIMKFQHTHDTRHNAGHGKDAESPQVPYKPILKTQEYWPVILMTNMLVLWILNPCFQDMFSFPALRVLPRQIFGKSSLCLFFNVCESRRQSCFVGRGVAVPGPAEQEELSSRHLASGQRA